MALYCILGFVFSPQEVALCKSTSAFAVLCYPCSYHSLLPLIVLFTTTFWSSNWSYALHLPLSASTVHLFSLFGRCVQPISIFALVMYSALSVNPWQWARNVSSLKGMDAWWCIKSLQSQRSSDKAYASSTGDSRIATRWSHISDSKIGPLLAVMPSARTAWSGVSMLWLGEV